MKVVVQRVKNAKVVVEDAICGQIGQGLLLFVGIHKDDAASQIDWLVNKILNLRIFADDQAKMNLSIQDIKGELLIVSQFTLYANCQRGNRPDFLESASGEKAENLYNQFVDTMKQKFGKVETGRFGKMMEIYLMNDGPVTLILEGKNPTH